MTNIEAAAAVAPSTVATTTSSTVTTTATIVTMTVDWPWLKDVPQPLADSPIPPIDQHDDRLCVKSLIVEHRNLIDQVQDALINDPLYRRNKHDDVWILRFVLSHKKKVAAAIKAAKYTLAFRNEHRLDETDIRYHKPNENDAVSRYMEYVHSDAIRFVIPDPQRSVLLFIDIGGVNQHGLAQNVDERDWLPSYLQYNERAFQWLDYITRRTGRLTKLIRVIDGRNIQMSNVNLECFRRDGVVMKLTEDCYPQLVASMYVCDAPCYIQYPWRYIIRPLFPKRIVTKFDFISPLNHRSEHQRLLQYINDDQLPARYGGLNKQWPVEFPLPQREI